VVERVIRVSLRRVDPRQRFTSHLHERHIEIAMLDIRAVLSVVTRSCQCAPTSRINSLDRHRLRVCLSSNVRKCATRQ
jgi:hypothetical protein